MSEATAIAIIGVGALFPGSQDSTGFWKDILAGRDLIREVPPSHWLVDDYYDPDPRAPDKTYARRGAFLDDVVFDAIEFGIPPNTLAATDTSQLLALIVAQKVLEDATQGQFERLNRERVSVILGVTYGQELLTSLVSRLQRPVWSKALRESGIPDEEANRICDRIASNYPSWQEASFPGLLGNVVAGRIANRFDLHGTNCITDAACASSLSALSMAVNELRLGESDMVITGGVDTMNDISMYMCFSKTPALSRSNECRPFSSDADGTMLGEGLGMFALKRLVDAESAGDRIYAVLRGIGSSSDGRSKSIYAPLPIGQSRALRRAYESAGYGPETVELVEAHGTGTRAGDVAEFEGLRQVFPESERQDAQWCAIGSVKSQIGHTKGAAGAAGLFKAVMSLHHKVLPATIKVDDPNPQLQIEKSPFYLNTTVRPWIRGTNHPRRASVSSFGFGGTNFHVTVEEYQGKSQQRAYRLRTSPVELVVLSSGDTASLLELMRETEALAIDHDALVFLARTTQERFQPQRHRLAVIATSAEDLREKLTDAARSIRENGEVPSTDGILYTVDSRPGRVALLFPGQGSQYLGMSRDIAVGFEEARAVWDAAANTNLGLHDVVFPKFSSSTTEAEQMRRLTATEVAQPAIVTASLSMLEILKKVKLHPDCTAGHSLGELTALHAAGVIDANSLIRIARRRGEMMAATTIPGAMLAVSLSEEDLEARLGPDLGGVVMAHRNHPKQTVLSGKIDAIDNVIKRLEADGVSSKRLQVSTAFHSPVVAAAVDPFAEFLQEAPFSAPKLDVYSGGLAKPYPAKPAKIRTLLAAQIAEPMRFIDQVEEMYASGVRTFIECGPGSVLTDFVRQILKDREHNAIAIDRKGKNGEASLWTALGSLLVCGVNLDLSTLWSNYAPVRDPALRKAPAMEIQIRGSNYGKPYPASDGPEPSRSSSLALQTIPETTEKPIIMSNNHKSLSQQTTIVTSTTPDIRESAIEAIRQLNTQLVEAQAVYQRTSAEGHSSFLRMLEVSVNGIQAAVTGQHIPVTLREHPAIQGSLSSVEQNGHTKQDNLLAHTPSLPTQAVSSPEQAPVSSNIPRVAANDRSDLLETVLAVIAEATGYPVAMLQPQMDLEADLGIDSIKRVEILVALYEKLPNLREMNSAETGMLRTIEEVVGVLRLAQEPTTYPVVQ